MNANWKRAMLASLILIFSSLAGCLDAGNDASDDNDSTDSLGVVMVSTYHIGELVKGIAGDQVTMQYMSQDKIPVHDYEPSTSDLIRLQNADLFFYHGLGLEPWVEATSHPWAMTPRLQLKSTPCRTGKIHSTTKVCLWPTCVRQ